MIAEKTFHMPPNALYWAQIYIYLKIGARFAQLILYSLPLSLLHVPSHSISLLGGTYLRVDQNWICVFRFSKSKRDWRKYRTGHPKQSPNPTVNIWKHQAPGPRIKINRSVTVHDRAIPT